MGNDFSNLVSLKDVVLAQKGVKPLILKVKKFENSIPYLDINALETGNIGQYTFRELGHLASDYDVLVVWDGSRCGYPLKGSTGAIGSTLMSLTPVGLLPEYLYYFIKSKYDLINGNPTGTGIPHVDPKLFFELRIPLLPEEQQQNVINTLNLQRKENLKLIDQQKAVLRETLKDEDIPVGDGSIESVIEDIKSVVLRNSFSGKLTSAWRKINNKSHDDWQEVTLESISTLITSGSRDWTQYYSKKGARFIRTQDIKDNVINKAKMIFVDLPKHVEGKRTFVEVGNLLITIVGSNIGKCAVVDENFGEEGYVNQAIALIKLKENVFPQYLHLFLQSPLAQTQINNKIYGDAQPDLNLKDVRNFLIPIPGIEEQKVIVEKVQEILNTLSKISINYRDILATSDDFEKSLLKQSFAETNKNNIYSEKAMKGKLVQIKEQLVNLEIQRKATSKVNAKLRSQILSEMNKKQSLLEIITESEKVSTEDLWKESKYYESKDVETFYEELSQLHNDNLIIAEFQDETNTNTYLTLK